MSLWLLVEFTSVADTDRPFFPTSGFLRCHRSWSHQWLLVLEVTAFVADTPQGILFTTSGEISLLVAAGCGGSLLLLLVGRRKQLLFCMLVWMLWYCWNGTRDGEDEWWLKRTKGRARTQDIEHYNVYQSAQSEEKKRKQSCEHWSGWVKWWSCTRVKQSRCFIYHAYTIYHHRFTRNVWRYDHLLMETKLLACMELIF